MLVVSVLVGACGGGAERSTTVKVDLREYRLEPNRSSVPAGLVVFKLRNRGVMRHEMWVVRTDLGADDLPTDENDTVIPDAPGVNVVAKEAPMLPRARAELRVRLSPGSYVLLCNLAGHYQRGMVSSLRVVSAKQ